MTEVTVKSYRPQVEARIMGNLEKAMSNAGAIVVRQAKRNTLSPLPSGKSHPSYVDRNILSSSIGSDANGVFRIEKTANEISVLVGTKLAYGLYLEFGTSRMPNYPWLFPALEMKRQEITEAIKAAGGKGVDMEVIGGIWEK